MTEDEAKTKWCPMRRRYDSTSDVIADGNHCIGSACMAFRWVPDASVRQEGLLLDECDEDLAASAWWDGRYWKRNGADAYVHRMVVTRAFGSIPEDKFIDHIDGNAANNRRGNLRIVSKAENAANAASRGGASKYRGVFKGRNDRWCAQIAKGGIREHLGTFDTEEEAAAAYDEAAKRVHGDFARLNLSEVSNSGRSGYCGLAGRP